YKLPDRPPIYIPPGPGDHPPFPQTPAPGKQPPGQQQQPGPVDPGRPEPQPKAGSGSDVAKAVAALPEAKRLLDDAGAKAEKDFGKLSTPDKVVLGTISGAIAAGAVAGIASDPAARKTALDMIDGQEIPVPGLKGVSIVPHTKGGGAGAGLSFDLVKIFGGAK
ncbi:MAG: hypothetical protein M3Z27_00085, partial [Actinomycetota bacterium]|nr:hypothetical protein [Actinomycetota bacterium]